MPRRRHPATTSRIAAFLTTLGTAALLGGLGCTPSYHDQEASWEPPTASEERVERIREAANAEGGSGA